MDSKRRLSESSSEDDRDRNFKMPRKQEQHESVYQPRGAGNGTSNSGIYPSFQRRESRTSTISSTSVSVSEDDDLEAQQLSQAIESTTSDSTTSEDEAGPPPAASWQQEPSTATSSILDPSLFSAYSSAAQKMMSNMGFKSGLGLGKQGQGIVEPVGLSRQKGRRGLGLILKGLEEENIEWDSSQEYVSVVEEASWMTPCTEPCPPVEELRSWKKEGIRKTTIEDETLFCKEEILTGVLKSKSIFDQLEPDELLKARTRSNPFETIRKAFFQNRAALKMANMDAVFDNMFTEPKFSNGQPMVRENHELLYFADVCAGPGGFSEYVLWRKRWKAKGFGFTLRGSHDFKLEDFLAGPPESFEPHYGVNGRDGDGDVFKVENIQAFTKFVLENTDRKGVHFMMADGGFSVDGQENIQEILSKQLYLCQFLVALRIVRTGGHFVCKVFDLFTPFSVGLVYLMYRSFEHVCIHKPNTSRPANSERYLICKGKREDSRSIAIYMMEINHRLNEFNYDLLGSTASTIDINEVVPLSKMKEDADFYNYIRESNNLLGERQIIGLVKIAAFCKNPDLMELRQQEIREECLKYWNVPDQTRKMPFKDRPEIKIRQLLGPTDTSFLHSSPAVELSPENLEQAIRSVHDWHCVVLGTSPSSAFSSFSSMPDRGFFLGLGRSRTFFMRAGSSNNGKWEATENKVKFDLPADSLIYAEIVQEMRGESRSMMRTTALHIIDAAFLGGEDIRSLDYKSRLERCRLFGRAIHKPSLTDSVTIRAKESFCASSFEQILSKLQPRFLKGGGIRERLTYDVELHAADPAQTKYFCPSGILFYRIVKEPFMIAFSKSQKKKYWYHTLNKSSVFECPSDAVIDFNGSFSQRLMWSWDENFRYDPSNNDSVKGKLTINGFQQFVSCKISS